MEINKTIKQTIKDAEKGNAEAQYELGKCYHQGDGVEKDESKAIEWFRKAPEQGQAQAQCELGGRYVAGSGIEKKTRPKLLSGFAKQQIRN